MSPLILNTYEHICLLCIIRERSADFSKIRTSSNQIQDQWIYEGYNFHFTLCSVFWTGLAMEGTRKHSRPKP